MTQFTPSSAPSELKALIGRVTTNLSALFSGVLINVERKFDLHQAMADLGACTSSVTLATTLVRLMVGAAIPIAVRLLGAISQAFGGVYQDRLPFAEYFKRH
jgi:hypothetical protein